MPKLLTPITHQSYLQQTQALYQKLEGYVKPYHPRMATCFAVLFSTLSVLLLFLPMIAGVSFLLAWIDQPGTPGFVKAFVLVSLALLIFLTIMEEQKPAFIKNFWGRFDRLLARIQKRYHLPFHRFFNTPVQNLEREILVQPYALRAILQPQSRKRLQHWLETHPQLGWYELWLLDHIFKQEAKLHAQFKLYFETCDFNHPDYAEMQLLNEELAHLQQQSMLPPSSGATYLLKQWALLKHEHQAIQARQELDNHTHLSDQPYLMRRL